MYLLEWEHAESFVHAGAVGEESGQGRLKEEAEGECVVTHSLLEERVATSFANDQIGPLHHHDRYEEGRVAGVLELFTGVVGLHINKIISFKNMSGNRLNLINEIKRDRGVVHSQIGYTDFKSSKISLGLLDFSDFSDFFIFFRFFWAVRGFYE